MIFLGEIIADTSGDRHRSIIYLLIRSEVLDKLRYDTINKDQNRKQSF